MEQQYLDLLKEVYHEGEGREDRTGTGTRSLFGLSLIHI
jgi:thymidylate synthase